MDDIHLARKYLQKAKNAQDRKISFDLSFMAYKNLMKAKRCKYTGVKMTTPTSPNLISTDRTIDRIDSSKGYESGNVCACCHAANAFKAVLERPNHIDLKAVRKIIKVMEKK